MVKRWGLSASGLAPTVRPAFVSGGGKHRSDVLCQTPQKSLTVQQSSGHTIQSLFGLFPLRHHLLHKTVKTLAVIVFGYVTKLMQYHVVDAFAGCFNQVGIERNAACGGAAAPLRLHAENT